MKKIIPLSELNLTNDFLFKSVMENAETARDVLECILQKDIEKVEITETEKTLAAKYSKRGIRMDVYLKEDSKKVYGIEMQTLNRKDLPRRSRYYHAQLDVSILPTGIEYYNELIDSMVIFICTFDPFGEGKYFYTFENMCRENPQLTLNDGAVKMFINTRGSGQVSRQFKDFLTYIENSTPEVAKGLHSPFIERLSEQVETVKRDREAGTMYMLYEQRMMEAKADGRREGRAEGLAEGRAEGLAEGRAKLLESCRKLRGKMQQLGYRDEDIEMLTTDFVSEIMAEYGADSPNTKEKNN